MTKAGGYDPMKIRIAEAEDLGALTEIYNQAIAAGRKTGDLARFSAAERRPWFDDHPPETYPIFVAQEDGRVVGYLSLSAYRPGRAALRRTAEVGYYVRDGHQRRGIASRLLGHGIRACPSLGIKTLIAIVLDANPASIALLEKSGFEKWGFLPGVAEFDGDEVGHLYYGLKIKGS
jgi:L-amino acid N-acyltransferase YncA